MAEQARVSTTVPLRWDEVYFTNCPMVSANNVDQELGWCREEFKKIGVEYAYFRSRTGEQLVPALRPQPRQPDPLRRPLSADPRQRRHPPDRLLGATQVYEGGCMLVRARDDIFRMADLQGQEDRAHEEPEHHQERLVAHPGTRRHRAHAADERHDHGRRRDRRVPVSRRLVRQARDAPGQHEQPVGAVAAPGPQARPGLPSAGDGAAGAASSTRSTPRARCSSTSRRRPASSRRSRTSRAYPDWTLQMANCPAVITCTDVMADEHPELVVAYMKAMIKVGRWANEQQARRRP